MSPAWTTDWISDETRKTSRDFEEQAERARVLASLQDQLNAAGLAFAIALGGE